MVRQSTSVLKHPVCRASLLQQCGDLPKTSSWIPGGPTAWRLLKCYLLSLLHLLQSLPTPTTLKSSQSREQARLTHLSLLPTSALACSHPALLHQIPSFCDHVSFISSPPTFPLVNLAPATLIFFLLFELATLIPDLLGDILA